MERTPWPMRSAPSTRSAPQTLSGPRVSPACGSLCSPAALARSKYGAIRSKPDPISSPPSPSATTPASIPSMATAVVYSAHVD